MGFYRLNVKKILLKFNQELSCIFTIKTPTSVESAQSAGTYNFSIPRNPLAA